MSDADVGRWIAGLGDIAADEAARSRSRERSLRQQADEDITLVDVLAAMAERAGTASMTTDGGRTVTGVVLGVGADFVALTTSRGRVTLVALDHLATVGTREPTRPSGDRRSAETGPRLAWALASLIGEDVAVWAGAASAQGLLELVGADVVGVHRGTGADVVYLPLVSVSEVSMASRSLMSG